MASFRLETYLQKVENGVHEKDGDLISCLISFSDPHVTNSRLALERPERQVQRIVSTPWDEIIAAHLKCIWCINERKLEEAYSCQSLLVQVITKVLQSMKDENWLLQAMYATVVDLRRFAATLDTRNKRGSSGVNRTGENLTKTAELIMELFRVCAGDSRAAIEDSKKWGMMGLCNQLFKIYFRINKLNLCKPMIRAIDNMQMKDKFSLAQRVTYNYYVGRKAMFEGNFKEADTCLSFSFRHCPRQSPRNKRLILIYLIPVKILMGTLPKMILMRKYRLEEFLGIVDAVRVGNLRKLNAELDRYEAFFIKCGIYLILEKLKTITYRNLFKKVCLILNTHQLPIDAFTAALQMMEVSDMDGAETECILANLIDEGIIKGYIAHQQQKLVVSKKQAFPQLSSSNIGHMKVSAI